MIHPLTGRKQSPEHIKRRVEATAKAKAAWTDERRAEYVAKVSAENLSRDPERQRKFVYSRIGRDPWNKGKKMPQYSGEKHWNYGNQMPQKSIEKMRKKLMGRKQPAEVIRKRFESRMGYQHSMETKIKIGAANSGESNGNWLGGKSREPYALIWGSKLFKNDIKERDNHVCQNPDCRKTCGILSIHHIDYNKKNCAPKNLITLCRSCNGRANYNRDFWEVGYRQIINCKYQTELRLVVAA